MRRAATAAALGTVALLVALALAGGSRGLALYGYVLFLAALATLALAAGLRSTGTPPLERLLARRRGPEGRVGQLESLASRIAAGSANAHELHTRLRPIAREVAATRLARRHGVDLVRQPERARAILGPRAWELVRPDREAPRERFGRGWPARDLEQVVGELEEL